MIRRTLIISDILEMADGSIVLAVNFKSLDIRQEYAQKSLKETITDFNHKTIVIIGTEIQLKTEVIDVQLSTSLSGFRNIFLKVPKSLETEKIKENDEVEIEL